MNTNENVYTVDAIIQAFLTAYEQANPTSTQVERLRAWNTYWKKTPQPTANIPSVDQIGAGKVKHQPEPNPNTPLVDHTEGKESATKAIAPRSFDGEYWKGRADHLEKALRELASPKMVEEILSEAEATPLPNPLPSIDRQSLIDLIDTVIQNTDRPQPDVVADAIIRNMDMIAPNPLPSLDATQRAAVAYQDGLLSTGNASNHAIEDHFKAGAEWAKDYLNR